MQKQRAKAVHVGEWIFLLLVLIALTANAIYWASKKEGFHIDEMFSYAQICSPSNVRPEKVPGFLNNWHDASFWEDFLIVSEEEAFDLVGAWNTAKINHAHPPLFFVVFELVSSLFFQNRFSRWSALTVNLIFFVLQLFVFYLLSKRVFKNRAISMASLVIYGISIGAVETVVFLRMYMMLTFFSTLLLYLHSVYFESVIIRRWEPRRSVPICFAISATLLAGALTQYYFLIFAFFVCLFSAVALLYYRQWRHAIHYVCFTCVTILLDFMICPSLIYDLLHSSRGRQAIESAADRSAFLPHLRDYLSIESRCLFGSQAKLFVLFLGLLLLCAVVGRLFRCLRSNDRGQKKSMSGQLDCGRRPGEETGESVAGHESRVVSLGVLEILQILFCCGCTMLVIVAIAPLQTVRYVMNLFPGIVVISLAIPVGLAACFQDKGKGIWAIAAVFLLVLELLGYRGLGILYLYPGMNENVQQLEAYSGTRACVLLESKNRVNSMTPYLTLSPSTYTTSVENIENIAKEFNKAENLLLYIGCDSTERSNVVAEELLDTFPEARVRWLFRSVGAGKFNAYYMFYDEADPDSTPDTTEDTGT